MLFKNKRIWITGASSGIGEHLAYAFAREGAHLILSSRKVAALNRVKENCPAGTDVFVQSLDLADHASIPAIGKSLIEKFGKIDLLINNGGISQRSLVKDTLFSVDKQIMDVNYLGTIAVTKTVIPSMIAHKSGQIVVMSSLMGKFSTPLRSSYAGSKHALHGFFNALRTELATYNIKVTIICPGFIQTNISVNALTHDGTSQQKMDSGTQNGMHPDVFSRKALRAIAKGKPEIYIGGRELAGIYVSRFFPGLFRKLIGRVKVT